MSTKAGLTTAIFVLMTGAQVRAQIAEPVQVDGGVISGTTSRSPDVRAFKGVPFAAPPVGALRWRPPQPIAPWNDVLKADHFAAQCVQLDDRPGAREPQSEDCLHLNIWTGAKSGSERRPVMVWIYGGGYRAGSTARPAYDGTALARRGVVFVSIAYRVGALGFLAHPWLSAESPRHVSGNYGLLDQIAALDWIKRNIASFGGDPDRVTIFGQSAGSISTSFMAASPLAKGKFTRLIGETGAAFGMLTPVPLAEAEKQGEAFAKRLGASSLADLRGIDAARIAREAGPASGTFQPINDGWVVPGTLAQIYRQGRQNDVAMLIGSNGDEAGSDPRQTLTGYVSGLRSRYGADADALLRLHPAGNDVEARAASRRLSTISLGDYTMSRWALAQAASGKAPIYSYRFTHSPPIPPAQYPGGPDAPPPGAWHGSEIVYALGNLWAHDWPWTAEDRKLSDILQSYWVNFATSGNPNGPGLPVWPGFRAAPDRVMELGGHVGPIARPDEATMAILARHLDAPAEASDPAKGE